MADGWSVAREGNSDTVGHLTQDAAPLALFRGFSDVGVG
jgi:hypothetical protein